MRQGEIRALVKEDVKDSHLIVTHSYDRIVGAKSTKADKERQIPIPGKLRDELLRWAPEKGFIFSVDNGVSPVSPDSLLDGLYARLEDLGIDHEKRNLCFHSWRHFFNTRLIASGVQGEITRAIVGHESEDMTERYLHLTASDMEVVARVQNELVKVVG
jgi:integrase